MSRRSLFVVFTAACLVRLVYALQVRDCPLFQSPTIDAAAYYDLARQFAKGHWLNPVGEPYWQPAFYSMLLALWMKLAGVSVLGIKTIQLLLGSLNCVLVAVLAERIFNRRIGLVTGLMAALYAPMIFFESELLTPVVQITLNLFAILLLLKAYKHKSLPLFGASGLLMGLSVITRPDVILFIPAAALWVILGLRGRVSARSTAAAALVFITCAVLPAVPVAMRNLVVGKDAVLISSNGGLNFYIGNNPDEEKTRRIRPGPDWDALQALPLKDRPDATPSAQSAWFYRKSLAYALDEPLDYASLLIKKTVMFFTAVEARRNHDLYHYREHSLLYSILLFKTRFFAFPFGIALPLAVFGVLRHKRDQSGTLLLLYLAAQFIAVAAFFVTSRYRITTIPVMLIYTAYGGAEMWTLYTKRAFRTALVPLAAALGMLMLANINLYGIDRDQKGIDADTFFYKANILASQGKPDEASDFYERSTRLNPDYEFSHYMYADLLMDCDNYTAARSHLEECLRIDPTSPAAHAKLGEIEEHDGHLDKALSHYKTAAHSDAVFVDKLIALDERAYGSGDLQTAHAALKAVITIKPRWAEARRSLGVVLMKLDRLDAAIQELRTACELDPQSADSLIVLGLACRRSGKEREAEQAFDKALNIGPEDAIRKKITQYLNKPR